MLIETGATIHDRHLDDKNATLLHIIARACQKDCEKNAEYFIENGANIDAIDVNGDTPLQYSVEFGKIG